MSTVPVIDIADLFEGGAARLRVARAIGAACEEIGFFCITGHGVDPKLTDSVRRVAREFFRCRDDCFERGAYITVAMRLAPGQGAAIATQKRKMGGKLLS